MKVSELQSAFLNNLKVLLPGWRFVSSARSFRRPEGRATVYFQVCCINHFSDFDATGNVAVEFTFQRKRVVVIGASLANIDGTGQSRHPIASLRDSVTSAASLAAEFERVGVPFLQRYSDPTAVLEVLQLGGKEATLISPIVAAHDSQVAALVAFTRAT